MMTGMLYENKLFQLDISGIICYTILQSTL